MTDSRNAFTESSRLPDASSVGTTLMPLTVDAFFVITAMLAASPALPGFVGALDPNGFHTAYFPVPPDAIPGYLAGLFTFTFAWLDLSTLDFASNPTCVETVL